ncbi:MAG: hypothetical protein M1832_002915 [Thelocarpon impressellum]|nr:MAG: hypothetical protein M1832_002915 [Thelocarpon impressellum]
MAGTSKASLFGGAITVDLPTNFADVSDIRQVPDNQEVYLARDGLTSIIFDLTERVAAADAATDEEALTFQLKDVVDNRDEIKIYSLCPSHLAHNPTSAPVHYAFATATPPRELAPDVRTPVFTALLVAIVRLEAQATDLVITVNVPHVRDSYDEDEVDLSMGRSGPLIDDAKHIHETVMETLEIKDWGLFGEQAA